MQSKRRTTPRVKRLDVAARLTLEARSPVSTWPGSRLGVTLDATVTLGVHGQDLLGLVLSHPGLRQDVSEDLRIDFRHLLALLLVLQGTWLLYHKIWHMQNEEDA